MDRNTGDLKKKKHLAKYGTAIGDRKSPCCKKLRHEKYRYAFPPAHNLLYISTIPQVRVLRAQLEETDNQLEEAERKAKVAASRVLGSSGDGGGAGEMGGGNLREEERLFHDLAATRDELSAQKAARRDLETEVCGWSITYWAVRATVAKDLDRDLSGF